MFNIIVNPLTNEKVNILSKEGRKILKKYIKNYSNGGSGGEDFSESWTEATSSEEDSEEEMPMVVDEESKEPEEDKEEKEEEELTLEDINRLIGEAMRTGNRLEIMRLMKLRTELQSKPKPKELTLEDINRLIGEAMSSGNRPEIMRLMKLRTTMQSKPTVEENTPGKIEIELPEEDKILGEMVNDVILGDIRIRDYLSGNYEDSDNYKRNIVYYIDGPGEKRYYGLNINDLKTQYRYVPNVDVIWRKIHELIKNEKPDFDKSWENCQNYYFNVVYELGQIVWQIKVKGEWKVLPEVYSEQYEEIYQMYYKNPETRVDGHVLEVINGTTFKISFKDNINVRVVPMENNKEVTEEEFFLRRYDDESANLFLQGEWTSEEDALLEKVLREQEDKDFCLEDKDGNKCSVWRYKVWYECKNPSKIEAKVRVPPGIKNGDVVRFQGPYGGFYTLTIHRDDSPEALEAERDGEILEFVFQDHTLMPKEQDIFRYKQYIKIGIVSLVVMKPDWCWDLEKLDEAAGNDLKKRIFKLVEVGEIPGLVSDNVMDFNESLVSADHCNQLKPLTVYKMIDITSDEVPKLIKQLPRPVIETSIVSRAEETLSPMAVDEEESEDAVVRRLFDSDDEAEEEEREDAVVRRLFDSDDEAEEEDLVERRNASNTRPTEEIDLAELETRTIAFKIIGRIGYNSPEYNDESQPRYRGDLNKYDEQGLNYEQLKQFFSERGDSLAHIFNLNMTDLLDDCERLYQEKNNSTIDEDLPDYSRNWYMLESDSSFKDFIAIIYTFIEDFGNLNYDLTEAEYSESDNKPPSRIMDCIRVDTVDESGEVHEFVIKLIDDKLIPIAKFSFDEVVSLI